MRADRQMRAGIDVACATQAVDVGDGRLHVAVAGAGIDVVMLHGWTLDHRSWQPQLPLAARARLVMPDRRGFGRSTAPPGLGREWCDIDRLARAERFVLVGLSQGASVALDYARHRPERVAALVLAGAPLHDAVPVDDDDDFLPRNRFAGMVAAGQLAAMKAEWARHPLTGTTDAARPMLAAMLQSYDGRDLIAPASQISILAADIAALPMPVLAVAGESDTPWRRRVAAFIAATAPRGRIAMVDAAGHLCNLDNPARFNAILANVLAMIPH